MMLVIYVDGDDLVHSDSKWHQKSIESNLQQMMGLSG
jgi:hypothetical protein